MSPAREPAVTASDRPQSTAAQPDGAGPTTGTINAGKGQVHSARPPRRPAHWIRRILLGLGIALIVLSTFGVTYQAIATEIDKRTYPAPGQLVDVGGYKLHIHCMGQGSPTVILSYWPPLISTSRRAGSTKRRSEGDINRGDQLSRIVQKEVLGMYLGKRSNASCTVHPFATADCHL